MRACSTLRLRSAIADVVGSTFGLSSTEITGSSFIGPDSRMKMMRLLSACRGVARLSRSVMMQVYVSTFTTNPEEARTPEDPPGSDSSWGGA